MAATDFMANLRRWLNDELAATYKWTTAELVDYFNWAMDAMARETDYFKDSYTAASSYETITAGTPDYAIDSTVTQVVNARIANQTRNLTRTELRELSIRVPQWRYTASIAGTDIALVTGSPATITSTTSDFIDAGFAAGEYIQLANTTTTGNSKVVLVDTVAQHLITLATGQTLTSNVATPNVLIRQLYTDTPLEYLMDYRTGYITLYPAPDTSGMLILDCIRKQITALTIATIDSYTMPIPNEYLVGFLAGPLSRAYLKSGPSTFNYEKSVFHSGEWIMFLDSVKLDLIKKDTAVNILSPNPGTL